jgi:hypothetical protein
LAHNQPKLDLQSRVSHACHVFVIMSKPPTRALDVLSMHVFMPPPPWTHAPCPAPSGMDGRLLSPLCSPFSALCTPSLSPSSHARSNRDGRHAATVVSLLCASCNTPSVILPHFAFALHVHKHHSFMHHLYVCVTCLKLVKHGSETCETMLVILCLFYVLLMIMCR